MTLTTEEIRKTLEDSSTFRKLCNGFVHKIIRDKNIDDERLEEAQISVLDAITSVTVDSIEEQSESPIETIFLRSLILGAIRNGSLGLLVHKTFGDAEEEINLFRHSYSNFVDFVLWAKEKELEPDQIYELFDQELEKGRMDEGEREFLQSMMFKYYLVNLENCFHMTLQPKLYSYDQKKMYIRPDIMFWLPKEPSIKVIVECDGYQYHSGKKEFTNDRKRDRKLQKAGYKVLRYSGLEIFHDPIGVSGDIHEFLCDLYST